MILAHIVALTGRGRLIQKLIEGDPIAWSIVGGVVVITVGWSVIKKRMGGD